MSSTNNIITASISSHASLAQNYFNNVRVPAAVLASICMKEMFQLQATPTPCMKPWDAAHNTARSRSWRTLRYAYLLLMILSFSLEISTIFVSTQVSTQLATSIYSSASSSASSGGIGGIGGIGVGGTTQGGIEAEVSKSVVDFIIKEFEFEYTLVRCHFLTGLITFTVAQALRVRYILRKYFNLSISGMCCLLTSACGMITYTNSNTITYGGFISLLKRHIILGTRFLLINMKNGPMSLVTILFLTLTIYFALRGWFAPEFIDNRYGT
jgi:hypothetical protein